MGTHYVYANVDVMRRVIERLFEGGNYDHKCNCIEHFTLITHNGVGGWIMVADEKEIRFDISSDQRNLLPECSRKLMLESSEITLEFLDFVNSYMCTDGTMEFFQCKSGQGV